MKKKVIINFIFLFLLIFISFNFTLAQTEQSNKAKEKIILLDIPFTAQAPLANWHDPRQQDACEEASSLIVMSWVKHQLLTKNQALKEILAMADYEQRQYNNYHDTSALDTVKRLFNGYYHYDGAEVKDIKSKQDIISELKRGNAVIVPVNGQKLNNPYYTRPGPERHMLVIRGYDPNTDEFITNDVGTRRGEKYRYPAKIIENALRDYLTGKKEPIKQIKKTMIVIRPE